MRSRKNLSIFEWMMKILFSQNTKSKEHPRIFRGICLCLLAGFMVLDSGVTAYAGSSSVFLVAKTVDKNDAAADGYTDLQEPSLKTDISLAVNSSDSEGHQGTYNVYTQHYELNVKLQFNLDTDKITGTGGGHYFLKLGDDVIIPSNALNTTMNAYDNSTKEKSFTYQLVQDDGDYYILIDYDQDYLNKIKTSGRTIDNNTINLDVEIGRESLSDSDGNQVKILDNVTVEIDPSKIVYPDNTDGKSDISVSKSGGTYDKTTNTMKYYVTVYSAGGTENGINLEDVLSVADGATDLPVSGITVDSVKLTGTHDSNNDNWANGEVVTGYQANVDGRQISITGLEKLGENSKYEIEYTVRLGDLGDDFESNGTNHVKATTGSLNVETSTSWQISKSGIAVGKNGTLSEDGKTIIWTITVTNNNGKAITVNDDALKNATNLTVKDSAGQDVTIARDGDAVVLPEGVDIYTITYETPAVSSDPMKESEVSNTTIVTDGDQTKQDTGRVTVPAEAKASKEFLYADDVAADKTQTLHWRVTIDVPRNGFAEGTEFTETMSLFLSNPWADKTDQAYFTEEQKEAFVNQLKEAFGDALDISSEDYFKYTAASLTDDGNGNYTHGAAAIWWKLKDNWKDERYAGKKLVIEYTSTVNLDGVIGKENLLTNSFSLGNKAVTAAYSQKNNVTKKSEQGNSNDVTSKTVTLENNKLHWIVQVHLDKDTRSIVVTDTLPDGIKAVTDIAMGNGENRGGDMAGLYSADGTTWGTVSDWGYGVAPWQYTGIKEIVPSAAVDGKNVTITAQLPEGEEIPEYLKSGENFYFYIEVEVDDDKFPPAGKSDPVEYANHVDVSVNNAPYGSDDQTQEVTFETDVINKGGDASNWNKDGFHELAYSIDINPGGGDLTGGKDIDITLEDRISYNDTVYTYENGANVAHHVTVSLKGGSVKLQRKSGENWLDIPATEGWGYILDEGKTDANGVKTKTISVYGIPNNVPLRLVYVYNIEVAGLEKNATVDVGVIKNTATLKGDGEWTDSHTENKQWQNVKSNASSDSSGALTLVKVQEGNYAVTLPNAYFVLEKYDETATNKWTIVNAIGSNVTDTIDGETYNVYKTDSDGQLIITHKNGYENDVLYRVREYKAPAGFAIDEDWPTADHSNNIPETTGYFYFHTMADGEGDSDTWAAANLKGFNYNARSRHADNLLEGGDSVYLGNQRVTDTITAEKKWDGLSTWQDNVSIVLELRNKAGNKVDAPEWYASDANTDKEEWKNPQTLTSANTSAKWEHVEGKLSDYQVVETEIKVGETPGVLTRVEDRENDRLTWTDSNGNIVYETWGGTVTNGMATIVNASRTELKVNKIFTNTNSVDSDTRVEFTLLSRERLYARGDDVLSEDERDAQEWSDYKEVTGKSKLVLTSQNAAEQNSGSWAGSFSNLEKFRYEEATGNLYELQYFAEEKVYEGEKDITSDYRAEYSPVRTVGVTSGELTVTNSPNLGKLIVKKDWVKKDGTTEAPKDQAYVIINLQRYVLVDGDGEKHYDGDFNREHRNLRLSADTKATIDEEETSWAALYNNLQVHGVVYEEDANGSLTGKAYEGDFYYEVIEDTVTGYVTTYSAGVTSDGVKLEQATDQNSNPEPGLITVTNTESLEFKDEKTIDLNLLKAWYDEADTDADWESRFLYPDTGTEVSFRLYRYVTTERGNYDIEKQQYLPDESSGTAKRLDEEFNAEENDDTWTMTLTSGTSKTDEDAEFGNENYRIFAGKYLYDTWKGLPVEEVYVRDDSYVKYTYEYYVVENGTNVSLYMSDGKKDDPVTGESAPFVEIWNVVGTKFTISKRWVLLEDQNVPSVVVRLERRDKTKSNDDSAWEVVKSIATSPNGAYQNAEEYTYDSDFAADGTVRLKSETASVTGYLLSPDNEWTIVFSNLAEGYHYRVTEIGYYEDGVVKELPDDVFENKHYIYKSDDSLPTQTENGIEYPLDVRIDWIQSWAKPVTDKDAREKCENYGTMWLYNIEKSQGPYQLSVVKKWQPYDSKNGFSDISSTYTGKAADGRGEGAALVLQIYQRARWDDSSKEHYNQWASEWIEYKDQVKIYYDKINYLEAGFAPGIDQHNGWFEAFDNRNFIKYGYVLNEDGQYERVRYDYKFEEVGVIPGSDGRTFTNYALIYPDSADIADNNFDFSKQVTITNVETGPLEIKKEWKLSNPQNVADKVFFTVKSSSTRMPDVAKYIYESDEIAMFDVLKRNVAYLKELDEYVIVLSAEDDWDLIIRGLDIVDGGNGFTEVDYTVEEVAIARTETVHNVETDQDELVQRIIAVTDNDFPYTATYKTRVRNGQEQNAGNTKDNTATNTLKAAGLQIDSARNPITYVKVENDDTPTTSYTINKVWAGDKYPDDSTKVTVELQQRIQDIDEDGKPKVDGEGNPVWFTGWQAAEGLKKTSVNLPLEGLTQNEAWTYTWNNLPQYKTYDEVNGVRRPIWYRVVETSAPSWVDPIISDEGKKSAVNGKAASEYDATDTTDDGTYSGQTAKSADTDADSKARLAQTITNDNGKTDLTVSKKWQKDGADQDEWPANTEIDYKIVRHAYLISANSNEKGFEIEALKVDPVTTGTLSSDKQTVSIEGLERGTLYTTGSDAVAPLAPNFTYAVEYEYEVVETAVRVDGSTYSTKVSVTADADNPETEDTVEEDGSKSYAQIVNDLTDIKVVKTWANGDEGSNVVVQLYRSSQRPEGKLPVNMFTLTVNVPDTYWKTAEGNKVTEIPTQGTIIVEVKSSDGQTREITLKDGNWSGQLDLPRTTESQIPIEYSIEVKSVDGTNVLSATGEAEYESVTEDSVTVNLHATVPEPAKTIDVTIVPTYIDMGWQSANGRTPADADTITVTLYAQNGSYSKQVVLKKENNWSVTETVPLKADNGTEYVYRLKDASFTGTGIQDLHDYSNDDHKVAGSDGTIGIKVRLRDQSSSSNPDEDGSGKVKVSYYTYGNQNGPQEFEPETTIMVSFEINNGNGNPYFMISGDGIQTKTEGANGEYKNKGTYSFTIDLPASGSVKIEINDAWALKDAKVTLSSVANARQATFWDNDEDNLRSSTSSLRRRAPAKAASVGSKTFTESGADHLTVTTETVTDSNGNQVTRSTDRTPYGAEPVGEPITLRASNIPSENWQHLWSNLPKVDEDGNPVYYYVKEISATVPGNTSSVTTSYSYQKHNNDDARMGYKEVDINNSFETQETFGGLTVRKVVEGLPADLVGEYKVTIRNSDDNRYLTADGDLVSEQTELTISPSNGLSFSNLPVGTYIVTEITSGDMDKTSGGKKYTFNTTGSITTATATVTAEETATATIINKYTTSTEFTKTWKNGANVIAWPTDTTITVKVAQKAGETETGNAVFTVAGSEAANAVIAPDDNSENLAGITAMCAGTNSGETTYVVNNLPATETVDGETVTYTYAVEETAVTTGEENVLGTTWEMTADGNNITNSAIGSLKITKIVQYNGEADAGATGQKYYFGIYEDEEHTELVKEVEVTVGYQNNTEGDDHKVMDAGQGWTVVDGLPYGTYYVYELTGKGGSVVTGETLTLEGKEYTVTGAANPITVSATQANAEVTNNLVEKGPAALNIVKVDADGMETPLPGAEFTLQRLDKSGKGYAEGADELIKISDATDADGKTSFTDLLDGCYEVKETKLPDGYVLTDSGTFYIKVQSGEITLIEKDPETDVTEWQTKPDTDKLRFTAASEDAPAIVTVGNVAGEALPATGGSGTAPFTILGSMLTLLSGVLLVWRRRRRLA